MVTYIGMPRINKVNDTIICNYDIIRLLTVSLGYKGIH